MYLQKLSLRGRNAFVTGGGRGIGLAICEALAEAGARIVIADRDARVASEGRQALAAKGYDADVIVVDVTAAAEVTAVADHLAVNGDEHRHPRGCGEPDDGKRSRRRRRLYVLVASGN